MCVGRGEEWGEWGRPRNHNRRTKCHTLALAAKFTLLGGGLFRRMGAEPVGQLALSTHGGEK